ncbi:MAG: thioredoxin [Sphingomonadales bacterium]
MATKTISDGDFSSDVLGSETPVLVDFWATWCGPCKMLAPSLEELSEEFAGQVVIAKLDVDESPDAPARYGVRGVPTLMLFKGGDVIATKVGPASRSQLRDFINQAL